MKDMMIARGADGIVLTGSATRRCAKRIDTSGTLVTADNIDDPNIRAIRTPDLSEWPDQGACGLIRVS